MPDEPENWRTRLRRLRRHVQLWTGRHLPPGLRLVAGLLLIAGGLLGFLPVLGFWMIPIGIAVAALDVVPLIRWLRGRKK
ncbi:hypothetical protein PEL8287_02795 [Roseovarius litorisediminis]|uniref:Transmembrane protein (PGPGW) n=1 Tax=Roseovarius litorisediminis TaxID=1312363 RepID=A0A1Y5T040_9RHOB|nr:hypothetical protein [Roseovarius litorisediminis]SLN52767.1 hypothetical protein PEL8287_02795 [Roseovarius litorisediminis]